MADLTYTVNLDEDEITVLMQLLNARLVAMERNNPSKPDDPVRFESALLVKLLSIRRAGIDSARATGKLR